jgi:hypothetical protein
MSAMVWKVFGVRPRWLNRTLSFPTTTLFPLSSFILYMQSNRTFGFRWIVDRETIESRLVFGLSW